MKKKTLKRKFYEKRNLGGIYEKVIQNEKNQMSLDH
jgi:hypothetical protein